MKKWIVSFFALLITLCSLIGLASCKVSVDENGISAIENFTKLPAPNIVEVKDNYVYWEEVPNASSYLIKINNYQESTGNKLNYWVTATASPLHSVLSVT